MPLNVSSDSDDLLHGFTMGTRSWPIHLRDVLLEVASPGDLSFKIKSLFYLGKLVYRLCVKYIL